MKCAVKGCENRDHEGKFMGYLCSPCHHFIAGKSGGEYSQAARNLQEAIAAERERIIAANAPEIERLNAYIKTLEEARNWALEEPVAHEFAGVKIKEVRFPENMTMRFDGDVLVIERAGGNP